MASSLKLRLERAISANRLSSALELPLDRKLGDLSRYTYVYADALPLRMERRISDQPPSNVLPLGMTRKLGTIFGAPVIVPPIDPEIPVDPEPPLEYAPPMTALASYISNVITSVSNINQCRDSHHNGRDIANDRNVMRTDAINIAQRYAMQQRGLIPIANDAFTLTSQVFELAADARISYIAFIPIYNERQFKHSSTIGYTRCVDVHSAKVVNHRNCTTLPLLPTVNFATSAGHKVHGVGIDQCQAVKIQHVVQVPDRYYPIPEPPPVKPDNVCRIRPPSSQLPLRMARQRRGLLSSNLPLSLTCWHDDPPLFIPSLRTYIMHNIITANIGGIAVDPLGFNIKTDMDSYCWSGGVSISPDDHARVKHKLDVDIGLEPMINVMLNDMQFAIIAENPSRSRQFGKTTHNLDGRSITARLGADYATPNDRLFDQANYASQIVNEQLANLPFIANFEIDDWLIPAGTYAVSNKAPMGVIAEIADAVGGFVSSHLHDATLSIKSRWKTNAWSLSSATPDVTIPADVIILANDKPNKETRYNTVILIGDTEAHEVYRATQGRDSIAPVLSHALYTDQDATVPKGTAVLSDSGTHAIYSLKMLMTDAMPLAELGQIWQINDTDGAWRGLVTGIAINVELVDDAPNVYQTLTVDRYMDN